MAAVSSYYGRHLLAWGINRAARHATGRTYPELWAGWRHHLEVEAAATVAAVEARGRRSPAAWRAAAIASSSRAACSRAMVPAASRARRAAASCSAVE